LAQLSLDPSLAVAFIGDLRRLRRPDAGLRLASLVSAIEAGSSMMVEKCGDRI
jgi:hypothetical protein